MTVTTLPTITFPTDDRRAVRTRPDDVRSIPTVLKSEWIKLRSVRANQAIVVLTVVINAFTAWAIASFKTDKVVTASEVFVYPTVFAAVLAAIAGILLFTSEAQRGTLATSLTAQPVRWVIAVSKMTLITAVGLALGVAGMITAFFASLASGLALGDTSAMPTTALCALVFTALAALIGLGLGMIARHSAAAISGLLVWWFVLENLVRAFAPPTVTRFLPFDAGYRLLGVGYDSDTPSILATVFHRPTLALIFATYAAVALAVGTVLLYRRDSN